MLAREDLRRWLRSSFVATIVAALAWGAAKYCTPAGLKASVEHPPSITSHYRAVDPNGRVIIDRWDSRTDGPGFRGLVILLLPFIIPVAYLGAVIGLVPKQWLGTVVAETFLLTVIVLVVLLAWPGGVSHGWSAWDLAELVAIYLFFIAAPAFFAALITFSVREAREGRRENI
jgi:hypothetical protein